jgi:hypothetical protein
MMVKGGVPPSTSRNWDVGIVDVIAFGIIRRGKYISKAKKFNVLIKNAEMLLIK